MKKREKSSGGIFKALDDRKKPVIGEEVTPKPIRHIERPVKLPFLTDLDEGSEKYGSAEDMQDKWGLSEKQATLGGVKNGKNKLEFYITRAGSSYSGSAGSIGKASDPKTYFFNL